MLAPLIRPYVITCGLLLVPALAWNATFLERLPPAISNPDIWGAIPQPLAIAENLLRVLVFAVPFFMPLQVSTRRQRAGIALFVVGTLGYFASWLALIASPQSSWATSAAGQQPSRADPVAERCLTWRIWTPPQRQGSDR